MITGINRHLHAWHSVLLIMKHKTIQGGSPPKIIHFKFFGGKLSMALQYGTYKNEGK